MTTEMITLKLDDKFLKDIDKVVKNKRYHNRTEFIRESLRKNLDEIKYKEAMAEIVKFKGIAKRKITSAEYERVRKEAFEELEKKTS